MDIIQGIVKALTGGPVIALMALLAANFVLALIAAIQSKTFNLAKLSDLIPRRVAPFLAYAVVAVLAEIVLEFEAMAVVVYIGLAGLYVKGILAAIKSITGLPIPDNISEKLKE